VNPFFNKHFIENKDGLAAVVAVLALGTVVYAMARNLFQPWNSFLEGDDGALYSSIARNYVRYGSWRLGLGQAVNYARVSNLEDLAFYQHHPPLLPLLISGSFHLLGESEGAARLVTILFSLGSIGLVYRVSEKFYGKTIALCALAFLSTLPGFLFFARKPGHEPISLFFILLSFWLYLKLLDGYAKGTLFGLYLTIFLGLMTAWPGYIWSGLLAFHNRFLVKDSRRLKIIWLGLPMAAIFAFCLLQVFSEIASPGSLADLLDQARVYMGLYSFQDSVTLKYPGEARPVPFPEMALRVLYQFDTLFAYPVLILAALGVWTVVRAEGIGSAKLLLFAVAVLYTVVFYRSVILHYWHMYYFVAPVALFAPIGMAALVVAGSPASASRNAAPIFSPLLGAFLMSLLLIGMIPRLRVLHQMQIKIFPDADSQPALFGRDLADLVRALSHANDTIVMDLPKDDEKIRQTIGYYAARHLRWGSQGLQSMSGIVPAAQAQIKYVKVASSPESAWNKELEAKFREIGIVTRFLIDGYPVYWVTVTRQRSE
jgi:4-amino-4-deoxy-L-arabinose transferase-like glycosyltransferase